MERIFRKHKKLCIILGVVFAAVLLTVYLCAFFQKGIWHRDAFLYRQKDGSFAGSDSYASYEMRITPTDKGAEISFAVNDIVKQYQIVNQDDSWEASPEVRIYENGTLAFDGKMVLMGDFYMGMDEMGNMLSSIGIITGDVVPGTEELFPDYNWLYTWAVAKSYTTRGNQAVLAMVAILSAFLILDIVFPNFFFLLHHGLAVRGGEPSDWYRAWQSIGQVVIGIAIIICMMLSFKRP